MNMYAAYSSGCPNQQDISAAADKLLTQLCVWMGDSQPLSNHLDWLSENSLSREDSRQIRYIIDVFYNAEPHFTILHALEACGVCREDAAGRKLIPDAVKTGRIQLAETNAGRPISSPRSNKDHAFFRALALWPQYFVFVIQDLSKLSRYNDTVLSTVQLAELLARQLCPDIQNYGPECSGPARIRLDASAEVVYVCYAMHRMIIQSEASDRGSI